VGTSFGNTLLRRYLQNTKWVKNATSAQEMKKFEALSAVFKQYAGQYDFDYLMIMAQGYQESLLDQSKRNPTGAVGIMQVIPKNAAASPINIPNKLERYCGIHQLPYRGGVCLFPAPRTSQVCSRHEVAINPIKEYFHETLKSTRYAPCL